MKSLYPRKKPTSARNLMAKVCAICEERKTLKSFHLLGNGYFHSYCKPCLSIYLADRYKKLKK